MSVSTPKQLTLKDLRHAYSPTVNPLIEPQQITTKRRYVRSGRADELMNTATGEITAVATIYQVEERDDAEFVKVFAAGVSASYELTKTAQRVFQVVLDQYQRTPMNRGYADYVNLFWFGDGIEGRDVGMSERTFMRGLKELIEKKFIASKDGTGFWTNPALFFKGDRVMFVKEYRRRRMAEHAAPAVPPVDKKKLAQLDKEISKADVAAAKKAATVTKRRAKLA
jgi:hypothetical protein